MELKKLAQSVNFKRFLKSLYVFIPTLILSFSFFQLRFREETILMIFLIGVLIVVVETGSYFYGFFTSIVYIFTYNFFFTEPYHTLKIYDLNNVISLIIFFFVSLIAGMLASRLQQQIKLTSQLEKAKADIENEKNKSMLLRSISHDLRSPLTGIAGSSSFLAENFDTVSKEDAVMLLHDMENDARSLTNMIENLLNMTRIQDGRLVLKKQKEVLDDLISLGINRVYKKDSLHKVVIDEDSQVLVCPVDGRLIVQVISNIVDNALKYTPEGSVIKIKTIIIEENHQKNGDFENQTKNDKKNQKSAVITINDNGNGIPEEMHEKIFETFYTSSSKSDSTRGLGLGLSICKTIIKAHDGSLKVSTNQDGGACFTIILPGAEV